MRLYKKDMKLEEWTVYLNSKDVRLEFSEFNNVDPWVEVPDTKPVDMTGKTIIEVDGRQLILDVESSEVG